MYGLGRKLASEPNSNAPVAGAKPIKSLDDFSKIKTTHDTDEDIKAINPKYKTFVTTPYEYSHNCVRCAAALEARFRGYNVMATPADAKNDDELKRDKIANNWTSMYKNPVVERVTTKADVEKTLAAYGNGARATIRVDWDKGFAHSFSAEQKDGETIFYDSQNKQLDASKYFDFVRQGTIDVMRVDNLEFSDIIFKCCKNKREKRYKR